MNNDEVFLRDATPEDRTFLSQLYADTRKEEVAAFGWNPSQQSAFLEMQFRMQAISYETQFPGAAHKIILQRELPVGRILVHRTPDEIRLVDLSILSQHRGSGIGTRLIRDLLTEGLRLKKPVRLQVFCTNRAVRLYERLGFVKIESGDMYHPMEWRPDKEGKHDTPD